MKKKIVFSLLLFLISQLSFFNSNASAHLAGQPPFFKMNGKYSNLYPVAVTTLSGITMPQDIGPENYLVNAPIQLEMDPLQLPFPQEIINTMHFKWDFGDGEKGEGLSNTHTYTKKGSYILSIYSDYTDQTGKKFPTQLIQSVLFNVLPTKNYKLPKAVISYNGTKINDPVVDTQVFTPGKEVELSAADSTGGSSNIAKYEWDLSDGGTADTKIVKHTYTSERNYVFPFLRITTKDGFISDTYVELGSSTLNVNSSNTTTNQSAKQLPLWQVISIFVVVNIGIITGIIFFVKKKK